MLIKDKVKCKVPFGTMSVPKKSVKLIDHMLANKMLTNGKVVETFEEAFAKKFNRKHAVAVSSGTDAVTIALAALQDFGLTRGDKVLIPALTFVATANAVINAGFQPKFVDVDRHTLNMDPWKLEEAIDEGCRAIVVVHLMGNPANMIKIYNIAKKYDLLLIEDCAEAHGARYGVSHVGSWGLMSCYSLYAAHIVSSVEGGMITTNEPECVRVAKSLRNHGLELKGSNWTFNRIGYSAKMNELEAAVGLYNLEEFDNTLSIRRRNFSFLNDVFKNLKWDKYFITLDVEGANQVGPHAFSMIVKDEAPFTKEDFVSYLSKKGIDNRNLFYCIPTQCEPYKKYCSNTYAESEFCSNNGTHIGIHQDLSINQLQYVIKKISEYISYHERLS